jgi:hypothetical protein
VTGGRKVSSGAAGPATVTCMMVAQIAGLPETVDLPARLEWAESASLQSPAKFNGARALCRLM